MIDPSESTMHLTDVREIPPELYPMLGVAAVVVFVVVGSYGAYCSLRRRRDKARALKFWASQRHRTRKKRRR